MSDKLDLARIPRVRGSGYPAALAAPCAARERQRLGDAAGLSQFGVNLTRLPPGTWSSLRHWHTHEDEFLYVLAGEAVLVTDAGESVLRAGDCAGFRAGQRDGHHLQNRGTVDVVLLEIGSRIAEDEGFYPGLDLRALPGRSGFARLDGTPCPPPPEER